MQRMKLLLWGVLGLLLVTTVQAAESTLQQTLKRMAQASKDLNYQGDLVYGHGGELSSLRITHVRDGKQEWEHLLRLDGRSRELVRGNGDVIYRGAKGATRLTAYPPLSGPEALTAHLAQLEESYDGRVSAGARVAGRDAVRVQLTGRAGDRYGYDLYLDKATGLLLKSVLVDEAGKPLETVSFSRIRIGPEVGQDEYRQARHAAAPRRAEAVAGAQLAPSTWQLALPAGFTATPPGLRRKRVNGVAVEVVTYSDGLASFSVFSEPLGKGEVQESARQRGATAFVSRSLLRGEAPYRVTLVGELPLQVAQRIAESIRFEAP